MAGFDRVGVELRSQPLESGGKAVRVTAEADSDVRRRIEAVAWHNEDAALAEPLAERTRVAFPTKPRKNSEPARWSDPARVLVLWRPHRLEQLEIRQRDVASARMNRTAMTHRKHGEPFRKRSIRNREEHPRFPVSLQTIVIAIGDPAHAETGKAQGF